MTDFGIISVNTRPIDWEAVRRDSREYARRYCTPGYQAGRVTNFERLKKAITKCVWSPCVFKNGYRSEKNFVSSDWIFLDFDDDGFTIQQAIDTYQDTIHIIGTTKSHQKEKNGLVCDRFRLGLKLDRQITDLATYKHNVSKLVRKYDSDPACVDGARFFFPCIDIVSSLDDLEDGYCHEVEEAPKVAPIDFQEINKLTKEMDQVPPWIKYFLDHGCQTGQRNKVSFRVACGMAQMGYPFEAILNRIMASPIPIDTSDRVRNEVRDTVKSAFRSTGRSHHA